MLCFRSVYLHNNKLTDAGLPESMFNGSDNLEILIMSSNFLRYVPKNLPTALYRLHLKVRPVRSSLNEEITQKQCSAIVYMHSGCSEPLSVHITKIHNGIIAPVHISESKMIIVYIIVCLFLCRTTSWRRFPLAHSIICLIFENFTCKTTS